jgi:hypothetical protein
MATQAKRATIYFDPDLHKALKYALLCSLGFFFIVLHPLSLLSWLWLDFHQLVRDLAGHASMRRMGTRMRQIMPSHIMSLLRADPGNHPFSTAVH